MILYIVFSLMALSLIGFVVCFIIFCHYKKFSFRDVTAPLKFFDFCFFEKRILSNYSMIFFIFIYIFGTFLSFIKEEGVSLIFSNTMGLASIVLFFFHCRFLSNRRFENENGIEFLKEFFSERKISINNLLLWLARLLYIVWIYLIFA